MKTKKLVLMCREFPPVLRHTVFVSSVLAVTILITEFLHYHFNFAQHNLVLLYVLSVLFISCTCPGYIYGFIAAVVGALACDFLIVTPRLDFSFSIGSPITLATLVLVTLITSTMASRLRQQKKLALNQQQHFELLYEINRQLLSARSIDAIVDLINTSLAAHVDRPVIFYTEDPFNRAEMGFKLQPDNQLMKDIFLSDTERQKVHMLFQNNNFGLWSQDANIHYQTVLSNERVAGVIGIYCGDKAMSSDESTYVYTLVGQVALAFEVQHLSDKQEKLLVDAEREKTRSALLRSVSHDFRTPIATIRGASAAMREHPDMPVGTREKLLFDIEEYSDWLIRMMENVLTVTRLSGESLRIDKKEEAGEEVIAAAVSIVRKRYHDSRLQIQIPDTLLMIPMDATLIAQVLINLLENAIKHSPAGAAIIVRLNQQERSAVFQVIDEGTGIAPHLIGDLFRAYLPPDKQKADAVRGSGIGLSICQTIVRAHNGVIEGHNRENGGAAFSFTLPLGEHSDAI
jgi:two-component system sensor histidine kinase KdpD